MANPSKPSKSGKPTQAEKNDRQRRIDEAMRKQRGTEKRRGFAIVGVCAVISLGLIGAAVYAPVRDAVALRQFDDVSLASIGGPAASCGEVSTEDATGAGNHVPSGQQVTYEHAPPAYGPHWNEANLAPAPFNNKFYDAEDRPELESLVHNLEHGYTILWYDDTAAADAETMSQIRAIATKFRSEDQNFRLKFIAAPWTAADAAETGGENDGEFPEGQHIAFSHWSGTLEQSTGVWQYCTEPSGEALETFMADYPYSDSPEANAP